MTGDGSSRRSAEFIPGYTRPMKTAISVPDDVFHRASQRAKDLGLSRSEFFARAAATYLEDRDEQSVTRQIDAALESHVLVDDSSNAAVEAGHTLLLDVDEEW